MIVEGYDNSNDAPPLIQCAQSLYEKKGIQANELLIKSYQCTFSSTKTKTSQLRNLFNHFYKEFSNNEEVTQNSYQHILVASHAFIEALEQSKLYSKIRVIIQPSITSHPHGIKLHFDIEDKFPYFLAASNEYDGSGTQIKLKFGNKNLLGYHDQFTFEYDKNISNDKSRWSINWSVTNIFKKQYTLGFQQQNIQQLQGVDENSSSFNFNYKTEESDWSFAHSYRYNTINEDNTLMGQYLFRRYIHNLDFLPSQATTLTYSRPFYTQMSVDDGVPQGAKNKINLCIGIPKLTINPFLKVWMSHQLSLPLYEHRNKIKKIKKYLANSSISCSINYGLVYGVNHLSINDTFQNITYRGFNQLTSLNNDYSRKYDAFAKLDFKYNIHNLDGLKDKNINLFTYFSLLTIGQPSSMLKNIRSNAGIGIAMPLGMMNLEALIPLYQDKKQFDRDTMFQIRIATDD